jgi:hypothetical protein
MEDFFKEFNEIDWRTYHTFSALSSFERFWRDTEELVATDADRQQQAHGPKWHAETEAEIAELFAEIRATRCVHDEVIVPTFRYAVVITLFAQFERELRRAAGYIATEAKNPITFRGARGSHFEHVQKFVLRHLGFDLSTLPSYDRICDLQKVRDCLVHCYGEAGLSRDRDYLLKLSSPRTGLEVDVGIEMVILPAFIERSLRAIRRFYHALFARLSWTVNQQWLPPGRASNGRRNPATNRQRGKSAEDRSGPAP